ncbi:INSulin related [Caenorhabditis elegans]|uniref:INSulin related n=1 Tax=Caenorhabditis elegans TaxID=6239 RepID=Q7JKM8_CAEEL|nr:INSulin related [Caenorhabditis elegans]CAE53735.1 INSulin related [Caenorhabditis elegans]|eukprot:NP_001021846.1 INSulin related [Caenorhabditis elegans]
MFCKFVFLIFLLISLSVATADFGAQRRCGRHLVNFLEGLCGGPCSEAPTVELASWACSSAVSIQDLEKLCCPSNLA